MSRRHGSPFSIFSFAVTFKIYFRRLYAIHLYTCLHSDVDTVYLNKRIMKEANIIKSQHVGFIVWIRRMLPTFRGNMLSPSSRWSRAVFCLGGICLNYTILEQCQSVRSKCRTPTEFHGPPPDGRRGQHGCADTYKT